MLNQMTSETPTDLNLNFSLEDLEKLKNLRRAIALGEEISKDEARSYYSVLQRTEKFDLLKKDGNYLLSSQGNTLRQDASIEALDRLINDFQSTSQKKANAIQGASSIEKEIAFASSADEEEKIDFEHKKQDEMVQHEFKVDRETQMSNNAWVPLIKNIVMTAISGTVYGDAIVTQIANLLGSLYIGNNCKVEISQVASLILPDGVRVQFSDEQLQSIVIRMEAIRNIPLSLAELQQGLIKHCQNEHWSLKRLFDGKKTPIEKSYITLSIIASEEYQRKQKQFENVDGPKGLKVVETFAIDERVPSHEDLFSHKKPIFLADLFKKQSNDENEELKRLLIFGRAGIGKSILCQYLAIRWHHEVAGDFREPIVDKSQETRPNTEKEQLDWLKKFKLVFWIRLREIPAFVKKPKSGSLENIINICCYDGEKNLTSLKKTLEQYKNESLFILDGYDEIEGVLDIDSPVHNRALLMAWNILKRQPNVIVTSRPTNNLSSLWPQDKTVRKLELMGFSNKQIENYVKNFMVERETSNELSAANLLQYLKSKPSIWGVAHIPINLEMICWLYRKNKLSERANNLSMLYEEIIEGITSEMSKKHKEIRGWLDTAISGQSYSIKKVAIDFLEHLAYQGMLNNELLLSSETIKFCSIETLKTYGIDYDKQSTGRLLEISHQLGFLFSTRRGGESIAEQTHCFIHLSFQEHFACKYIASRLTAKEETREKQEIIKQLQEDKYNPRYQLMWQLTAGLLTHQGKEDGNYGPLKKFLDILIYNNENPKKKIGFKLFSHCLDECLGFDKDIFSKFFDFVEYQKEIKNYFSCFRSQKKEKQTQEIITSLQKCPNLAKLACVKSEIKNFLKLSFNMNKNFVAYVKMIACKVLLNINEETSLAGLVLVELTNDKNIGSNIRVMACKILLKVPRFEKESAQNLIKFSQDKNFSFRERINICIVLLENSNYKNESIKILNLLEKDEAIPLEEKLDIQQILSNSNNPKKIWRMLNISRSLEKTSDNSRLLELAKNDKISFYKRIKACKKILSCYREEALKILTNLKENLKVPYFEREDIQKFLKKFLKTRSKPEATAINTNCKEAKGVYNKNNSILTLYPQIKIKVLPPDEMCCPQHKPKLLSLNETFKKNKSSDLTTDFSKKNKKLILTSFSNFSNKPIKKIKYLFQPQSRRKKGR